MDHIACSVNSLVRASCSSPSILYVTSFRVHHLYEFLIVKEVEVGDHASLVEGSDQGIIDGVRVLVSSG